MTNSHLESHIIAHFKINFPIDVKIHLGQTIYASQGFQMQGPQFLTQNFLNPLHLSLNQNALHLVIKFHKTYFLIFKSCRNPFYAKFISNPMFLNMRKFISMIKIYRNQAH